jgi:hypothetical protein
MALENGEGYEHFPGNTNGSLMSKTNPSTNKRNTK